MIIKKIAAKAKKLGVKKHYNIDAKKNLFKDYIFHQLKQMHFIRKNIV